MINPMDLSGRHIVITGGSSGIGRACAVQASRLGAEVTVIARSEERLRETISMLEDPQKHACYCADLSETDKIAELIQKVVDERGAVDGFCHAAGIGTVLPLKLTKPNFLEKMFRIHTFAFVECVRALALKKNLNDGASLVGITSVAAENGNTGQCAYSAAKGAMNSFIKPVAKELSGRKIRVNTVAFGAVDTPMSHAADECIGEDEIKRIYEAQFLGAIDVETAANAVMFLLSGASKFTTASVLHVYGGY